MRHTLIPIQDRLRIHREYHTRLLIVAASVLSVAVVLGAVGLAPAYLSAWSANSAALASLAAARGSKTDSGLSGVENSLNGDQKLLAALAAGTGGSKLSVVIQSIAAVRSSVRIYSLDVSRQGDSTVVATLNGQSPTRDDLLAFKSRLEAIATSTTVDLPLSELAKSTDVYFSMKITQNNP
jgi:hypothetical protein